MNYEFNGNYSDKQKELFISAQDNDLVRICEFLKTDIKIFDSITFKIFDTREGKQKSDPNHSISRASARFDEMSIYRFWVPSDDPHFPHEITHLVSHKWAKPYIFETELDTAYGTKIIKKIEMASTSFMQEGLAIAVDDIVFGRPLLENGEHKSIDDWCRNNRKFLPIPLIQVINFQGFGDFANEIIIPYTASLSKYLITEYGLEKYKKMYISISENLSPKANLDVFESIYAKKESVIVGDWFEMIVK